MSTTEIQISRTAQEALDRVLALRRVTYETNTVTRRSQNQVLQTLNNGDLIVVAEALEKHRTEFGW